MRSTRWRAWTAVGIVVMCVCSGAVGAERPQFKDLWRQYLPEVTQVEEKGPADGRRVIRYEHPCRKEWGFADASIKEYFLVVTPARKTEAPPLYVYLHAAGGHAHATASSRLGPEFCSLYPNAGLKDDPGWWWGYRNEIRKDPERYRNRYSPSENRILATIEWTVQKFNVDRNRIYLKGYSMGGSGSLGLGMRRGDLFAAMWVGVPAGIEHVMHRMAFPDTVPEAIPRDRDYLRVVSGYGLPDAPPIVNFSSHTDGWCREQEKFLRLCQQGRHMMVLAWGPYGHTRNYAVTDGAAQEFPWLEIRRDEAYPVFTRATSDETYPGYKGEGADQVGQVNAYFRWKVREDTEKRFAVDLWLVSPDTVDKPTHAPEQSTAEVTLRRLQRFRPTPGRRVRWQLEADGKAVKSGTVKADFLGLVTVPRVTVTRQARTLVLTSE